ncbi:MAG: exodeoxyribonuclease VII small subunit [Candidatus Endobugula sp.]|jgi:exodeoxyribonuclease VII small subunit
MTNNLKSNEQAVDTSINFEDSIHALEELVNALENGDLSLEESLTTFEKGIRLTKECQQQLTTAEQKIALLTGDSDSMASVAFTTE